MNSTEERIARMILGPKSHWNSGIMESRSLQDWLQYPEISRALSKARQIISALSEEKGGSSTTDVATSADALTETPRDLEKLDPKRWEVSVRVDGEDVLTIGSHGYLAGYENIDLYGDAVRAAAEHLRSFIGSGEPDPCFGCGGTGQERWLGEGNTEMVGPCSVCSTSPPAAGDAVDAGSACDRDECWHSGKCAGLCNPTESGARSPSEASAATSVEDEPLPAAPSVGGGEEKGSASQQPDPIEPRGSLPANDRHAAWADQITKAARLALAYAIFTTDGAHDAREALYEALSNEPFPPCRNCGQDTVSRGPWGFVDCIACNPLPGRD